MSDSKLLYPPFLARVLAWETKSSGWWGLGQQESVPLFPPPYWHEIWLSLDQFLLNLPSAIFFQFFSIGSPHLTNSDLGPAQENMPCQTVRVVTTPRLPLTLMLTTPRFIWTRNVSLLFPGISSSLSVSVGVFSLTWFCEWSKDHVAMV